MPIPSRRLDRETEAGAAGPLSSDLTDKAAFLDFIIEIVRRLDPQSGFAVIPRRLVRDYEKRLDVSEAMIHAGSSIIASQTVTKIFSVVHGV